MYNSFQLARKYLAYYLKASNGKGHGMHSPFVFQFIRHVLGNASGYALPADIEQLRVRLLKDNRKVEVEDLGAGSRSGGSRQRRISEIARSALKPPRLAQLLFRLASYYRPQTILELGTSLGLTTCYFSRALPNARVITIEGSPQIASIAAENFHTLNCDNIKPVTGNFDERLPAVLADHTHVDLAYVDGNHRYTPTIKYFHQLLESSHEHAILVFDDIHWSREMERAWEEIKAHPSVAYTIDIFFLGFVFFRKDFRMKQNFIIRF